MRLFEFVLILINIIGVFGIGWTRKVNLFWAIITMSAITVQLMVEQHRWQLYPTYFVAIIVILMGLFQRELRKTGRTFLYILIGSSALLAWLFPIIKLPSTSGPYQVGTVAALVETAERDLMMQVWYPAIIDEEPIAPYVPSLPIITPALGKASHLPSFVVSHINLIKPRAHVAPTIASHTSPFPIILFSHGYGGIRVQNTLQIEELASQGYIVAATDHHPAAMAAVFPDRDPILLDNTIIAWDTPDEANDAQLVVQQWVADLSILLDQLAKWNNTPSSGFSGRINTKKVGVIGHSTGGGAAYEFCYQDNRCAAAAGLDPWVIPTTNPPIENGLTQPILAISTENALGQKNQQRLERLFNNNQNTAWWLTIANSTHYDYTDFPHLSPITRWMGMSSRVKPMELTQTINDYTRSFFNHHLQDGAGALLYRESTIFPDVVIRRQQGVQQ